MRDDFYIESRIMSATKAMGSLKTFGTTYMLIIRVNTLDSGIFRWDYSFGDMKHGWLIQHSIKS